MKTFLLGFLLGVIATYLAVKKEPEMLPNFPEEWDGYVEPFWRD